MSKFKVYLNLAGISVVFGLLITLLLVALRLLFVTTAIVIENEPQKNLQAVDKSKSKLEGKRVAK
jgi:hypothetical protein